MHGSGARSRELVRILARCSYGNEPAAGGCTDSRPLPRAKVARPAGAMTSPPLVGTVAATGPPEWDKPALEDPSTSTREESSSRASLFKELGGRASVEKLTEGFYSRLLSDEDVARFFKGVHVRQLILKQVRFWWGAPRDCTPGTMTQHRCRGSVLAVWHALLNSVLCCAVCLLAIFVWRHTAARLPWALPHTDACAPHQEHGHDLGAL